MPVHFTVDAELMKKPKGRVAAIATGGCFVVLALLFWQDLVIQYYLIRLGGDTEYLRELAVERHGTIARRALLKFIQSDQGKHQLLTLYLQPLVDQCERRRCINCLPHSRTAVLAVRGGSLQFEIFSPTSNGNGSLTSWGKRTTPEFWASMSSLLSHLSGTTLTLDDYPEHVFSILPIKDINSKIQKIFRSNLGEDEVGLLMQHRVVLLDPRSRIVGGWEYCADNRKLANNRKSPIFFGSMSFSKDGHFRASKMSRSNNTAAKTAVWNESIHTGTYKLDTDVLSLSYTSGTQETYEVEFTNSDNLFLRVDAGLNSFRRPSDLPQSSRNKIGRGALNEPEG